MPQRPHPAVLRHGIPVVLALLAANVVVGHADDPKLLDRRPRVEAPAWRATIDGGRDPRTADAGVPDFPRANMALRSWLPLAEFGADVATGADCWGWTSPSGREYAIMTVSNAISFVEVSDPGNATIVATFPQPPSLWHDVKTYETDDGAWAYAVGEGGGGIEVFDLSQLDAGVVTSLGTVLAGGDERTHNVVIDEAAGMLYRCGGGPNGGLRIYDLAADPAQPAFVGAWTLRYVHDADVRTYADGPFAGRTIAYCAGGFNGGSVETGLTVLDVTDPASILVYTTLEYDDAAYAHQCWLNDDGTLLYLGDEVDELDLGVPTLTRVIDVSNPVTPFVVSTFGNGLESVDHNQYGVGDLLYQANYRTGVRVWDVADDPTDPVEIAFFDTFPESDGIAFNGAWNVYADFPSGTVIVSDLERGLFVLALEPPTLSISVAGDLPGPLVPSAGASFDVAIDQVGGVALVEASVVLRVSTEGGPLVDVPLAANGDGTFTATLPSGACGEPITYHVAASDEDGRTATFPLGAPYDAYVLRTTYGDTLAVGFADDFETDLGWTAGLPEDTAISGFWELAAPDADTPGEPDGDNPDGTGTLCYVTGDTGDGGPFQFVRGGFTSLVSPPLDATAGVAPSLRYAWWLVGEPDATTFEVALSNDDGATWTIADLATSSSTAGAWRTDTIRIADVLEPTTTMRVRFRCDAASFGEAAVDDVEIAYVACDDAACPGDLDGDGAIGFPDLLGLLADWGGCDDCATDLDGDGTVGFSDLLVLVTAWGPCT